MNNIPKLPLYLPGNIQRNLLGLIGSIGIVMAGLSASNEDPFFRYVMPTLLAYPAIVCAINLLPLSSYLRLTKEGFIFCKLYQRTFVPWAQVDEFFVIEIGDQPMVVWKYAAGFEGSSMSRKISNLFAVVDAALPDTYRMKADELATLLNKILKDARRSKFVE
jgi:hypothetical protein